MPDNISTVFRPVRRQGLFLLGAVVFLSLGASITLFILALQEQYGAYFILFLIVSLLFILPGFFMLYRFYALIRAEYRVSRDSVLLQWGLRREEIPLNDIDWVRLYNETEIDLRFPALTFPGAVLGTVQNNELGEVEFMASDIHSLMLISTPRKTYAISPVNVVSFLDSFRRSFEMGSLTPIKPTSVLPATYLRTVWADRWTRTLMLTGFILTLLVIITVSLIIPNLTSVSLGFDPSGTKLPTVPATQLLLLPTLCIFIFIADLIGGLFYFRKTETRPIAFTLWIGSISTVILLSTALAFILL